MAQRYETYKDSGVQWLGEIPGHWETIKLGIIFSFVGGNAFNSDNYSNEDTKYQLVRIGNVKNDNLKLDASPIFISSSEAAKSEKAKLHEGCILFTMTGTKGKRDYFYTLFLKKEDFKGRELYLNQRVGCLIPRSSNYNVKYYNYLFKESHILDSIFINETGTANQGNLGIESINRTRLHYPPLPEQQAIVSYLDEKCGKIDEWLGKKQKEVEHLQELKQRIIADAVTRGLNPDVKMKATNIPWLPEVPEHWKMVRNKSLLQITDEKVGERKDITLLSLTKQGVIIRDLSEGKGKFPKDFNTYLVVKPNNLVFCLFDIDETPRTVGLVHNYGMLTGAYTNFEVNEKLVLPEYIYNYYLQIDDVKGLRPYYTGLRKVVKTNTFLQIKMPVPPLSEQQAIVTYITDKTSKIDTLITNINKEIENIKEYKQRLISDVVTGQIKVC